MIDEADKLLLVIEDAARVVKLPIEAEKEPAVNKVVTSVTTFPRFAARVLVVIEEARRTVKFPTGADNDAAQHNDIFNIGREAT